MPTASFTRRSTSRRAARRGTAAAHARGSGAASWARVGAENPVMLRSGTRGRGRARRVSHQCQEDLYVPSSGRIRQRSACSGAGFGTEIRGSSSQTHRNPPETAGISVGRALAEAPANDLLLLVIRPVLIIGRSLVRVRTDPIILHAARPPVSRRARRRQSVRISHCRFRPHASAHVQVRRVPAPDDDRA
jgi:hypothetical protein